MKQTAKKSLFIKLLACFVLLFSTLGVLFSGFNPWKSDVTANAETIEYQDLLGVENRDWGAASDEYYFGGVTLSPFGYFNSADSVNGCWYNGNNALISANNGVDIMQYIYVNGKSARDAITENNGALLGSSGWLTNPAASPVYVETTNGSGIIIKILKAYAGESFTLTFKAGFSLIRNDGAVIYVSDDIIYNCVGNVPTKVQKSTVTFNDENGNFYTTKRVVNGQAIGDLPAVPAKADYVGFWKVDGVALTEETVISTNKTATPVYAIEYQDYLGLEVRAWASDSANAITLGLMDFSITEGNKYFKSSVSGCWYQGNNDVIAANNGFDILQYIYVNGECARDLLIANTAVNQTEAGTGTWLSNPLAWPVAIETGTDVWLRFSKTKFTDTFTITFKKGFSLIRNDGAVIYVSSDITYTYENGTLGERTVEKEYKLSFEGTDVRKTLKNGAAIGELPAVPAKDGYVGVWTIDGVEITADTVYNYGVNKTATAVYKKDVTETVKIEFAYHNAIDSKFKIFITPAAVLTSNNAWNIQGWAENLTAANNGVDIMNYIYVNGENIRTLSDNNRTNNTYPVGDATGWFGNSDQCRPVFVETNNEGIWVNVLHSFSGEEYRITLKAGFAILDANGGISVLTEDVEFICTSGGVTKVTGYTLTFEGAGTKDNIEDGQPIGELPAVPAKDGYVGVWTIDGVEITADTVYNYGVDKTAKAVYTKDVTETVKIEFTYHNSVDSKFKIFIAPASELTTNSAWNIQGWAENLTAANNGVDIMNYIYVNGENIRTLSDNNRTNNTYPLGDATGWFTNSDQCRPVFVETNGEGIWVNVLHSFSGEEYKITLKAGFAILDANGGTSVITEDVEFICTTGGGVNKVAEYTLTFEGGEARNIEVGQPIGELPAVPANANDSDCEGVWTIDGVEITADTIYTFGENKTAVPSYSKDITKYIALENRTSWAVCSAGGEFAFGVLDMREENKVVDGDSTTYYLNTNVTGCWYHGNDALISANNGVDIMEYILIDGVSARKLITDNANGATLTNGCTCWLSNPAASPVYVETTNGSGIMIKLLSTFVGDYFEITFKNGFSLINEDGVRVYLTKDVTYKYIKDTDYGTLAKGELTDAELDQFNGKTIKLMDSEETYLEKKTVRLKLPELEAEKKNGIMQTFIGWTTDPANLSDLYPAGYKWEVKEGDVLYAVWIGFEMQDGAAVRLTQGSAGIRFLVDISQADFSAYYFIDNPIIQTWGVLLAPTDYLNHVSAFTYEALGANCTLKDCSDLWKVEEEEEPIWTYAAAFVNIKESQFSRRFSARGYLEINYTTGTGYVYTSYVEENNARSIYEVALMAYDDEENPWYQQNTTILNYINNVANITWNEADYSFAASDVAGNYEITDISLDGYTVTVTLNGDITSAVVNGARLAEGSSVSNVKLGSFVFNVSGFEFVDGGFKFTIGAANDTYDKLSEETLYFASSDTDLDFFLNDYFKRHSAYVENGENLKVNTAIGGVNSQEFFSHEWLSMAYYWYNSFEGYTDENGNVQNRIAGLRKFLSNVPVDDYGYVWSSNDNVRDAKSEVSTGEQKMGWPFPNNETVKTTHWEFNGSDSGSWSSNISAKTSGGLFTKNVTNQSANITFTSNSFSSLSSKKIYTFYAPLLEFEVRIDDATNVEDIYVWYTTSSSTSFSNDKRVSVNEKAFIKYDYNGKYEHVLYLPMYAESAWGESTSTYVKQIKIEIVLKSGKTISGNVGLNYVRPTLDTRMSNNNSILISSLRTDYDYTGDLEFLAENITRARKAMNFLMQMYDADRGLKKESYLVGHGGTKKSLNILGNATAESIASSISQGYWDIMYMPEYDFQSNTYFYKAVRDLAYLEKVLADNGITVDEDATVKTATRNRTTGTCAYNHDLNSVADTVLANLRQTTENTNHTGFWNATEGRFVAGYASGEGKWYDYGYVAWNLEAIYYGIATEEQAEAIMNWLASEDQSKLYKYAFAPISNTVTGDADMLNGEYAAKGDRWVNCQFGGAIMYTSFYDLMARIDTNGADDAFARLAEIQEWYQEVYDYYVANGTNPEDFYRYYYDNKGIQMQGTGTAGAVGLDDEFLESFLPVSAVAYGFFGIDSIDGKTLEIAPELPADLDYWKMENLAFNMVKYDATICKNAIVINNVRGNTAGLQLQLALNYTQGQKVYVNGVEVQPTKVENGKAYVTVAFGAAIVEVR